MDCKAAMEGSTTYGQFEAQKVTTESVSPNSINVRYDGQVIGAVQRVVGTDQYCCAVQLGRRGRVLEVFATACSITKGAQAVAQRWWSMQPRVLHAA
jgi:hypothetical protein